MRAGLLIAGLLLPGALAAQGAEPGYRVGVVSESGDIVTCVKSDCARSKFVARYAASPALKTSRKSLVRTSASLENSASAFVKLPDL